MNEHSFTAKIIKKCREQGIVKAWKVNDNFAGGVPDAWFLGDKNDLWVEFKWIAKLPKREGTVIVPSLSALQLSWLKMLRTNHKHALVIIGYPKNAIILHRTEEWESGITVKEAAIWTKDHNQLVEFLMRHCMFR